MNTQKIQTRPKSRAVVSPDNTPGAMNLSPVNFSNDPDPSRRFNLMNLFKKATSKFYGAGQYLAQFQE